MTGSSTELPVPLKQIYRRGLSIEGAGATKQKRRRIKPGGKAVLAVSAALLCLFCAWFGARAAQPFVMAARLRGENDNLEREWKQLVLENQRLERDIKLLGTREGVLREARKSGFVLPGEYRLRIPEK